MAKLKIEFLIGFFIVASSLVSRPSSLCAEPDSLAQQAQFAWKDRDKPGKTEQAIGLWEEALRAQPDRGDLWTLLAKAEGRAVRHAKTEKERKAWADKARAAAQKGIEKSPTQSDAYAAYGEALGQWADANKGVHSLKAVRHAVEALNRAIALDPKNAYAHMLIASFYRQAPSVISVGDKTKAFEHAKLAVEHGPGYAINHLILARCYLDRNQRDAAIQELKLIESLTPPADAIPETQADQATAKQLLQDLGVAPAAVPCGQSGGYCSEQDHS